MKILLAPAAALALTLPGVAMARTPGYAPEYVNYKKHRDEPVYGNTRVWRGNDNRYYCRRSNGTTGLIIGAAGGALAGRAIDTRGDRALGTILGAAGGAIIGRKLDRSRYRCR